MGLWGSAKHKCLTSRLGKPFCLPGWGLLQQESMSKPFPASSGLCRRGTRGAKMLPSPISGVSSSQLK